MEEIIKIIQVQMYSVKAHVSPTPYYPPLFFKKTKQPGVRKAFSSLGIHSNFRKCSKLSLWLLPDVSISTPLGLAYLNRIFQMFVIPRIMLLPINYFPFLYFYIPLLQKQEGSLQVLAAQGTWARYQ